MGRRKHRSKGSTSSRGRSTDNYGCDESVNKKSTKMVEERKRDGPEEKGSGRSVEKECQGKGTTDRFQEVTVPIGIRSRLTYPLVQPSLIDNSSTMLPSNEGENDDDDDGEEEKIELNVRPRFVFVSSLCATCMEKSRLLCERCRMVSYCSAAHRSEGLPEHKELCEPLTEIRSFIASTLGDGSGVQLDADEYRVYRLKLLAILETRVERPLELWEREIVLYPRVCRVCRRFSEKLICCARCGMECFCEEHSGEHEKWCEQFEILQRFLSLQHKHGYFIVEPKIPNVRRQMFVALPDFDFDKLMQQIYGNSSYYRRMDCYTYGVLSHLCTIPVTALYSMQISCPEWQDKADWTIHVVGAEFQFEGINLHVWEKLFLHFLPNLKKLRLTLVGPELRLPKGVPVKLLSRVKVCKECKSAGRAVTVTFKAGKLYHDLLRNESERLTEPDLICIYNPGLYRKTGFAGKDSWFETIREFCKKSTPVTVTSYTENEMNWEITRIKSVADVEILLKPCQNRFASVKPDRNFVSDDASPLIYKNYYIAIVKGKS